MPTPAPPPAAAHRVRLVGALVAALTLPVLAGCTGADAGATSSTASAPTALAKIQAPTAAPAAVPVGSAGLEDATDFVLAWFTTLNYGLATGDADPLRRTTSLGCFTCAGWVTQVQQQHDNGERREGGLLALGSVAVVGQIGKDFVLRASLEQQPGSLVATGGSARPVPAAGSTEVVDLTVGVSTASLDGVPRWTMKAVTPPSG